MWLQNATPLCKNLGRSHPIQDSNCGENIKHINIVFIILLHFSVLWLIKMWHCHPPDVKFTYKSGKEILSRYTYAFQFNAMFLIIYTQNQRIKKYFEIVGKFSDGGNSQMRKIPVGKISIWESTRYSILTVSFIHSFFLSL